MNRSDAPADSTRSPLAEAAPPPVEIPLSASTKIKPHHIARLAVVYVRQSSPQQVLNNRESTARQYAFKQRAIQLGWSPSSVLIMDDDQAQTATTAEARYDFQELLALVARDKVGIILGVETSRLSRCGKDWHQLLEVCAIFQSLLADHDGVYDLADFNDRLVLGIKGTMNEAELHIMRSRLYEAMLNKARRGEAYSYPPIGYIKSPTVGFSIDPDEQVQSVVRLLFEQFERQGTVCGLLRYLVEHKISIPVRPHTGEQRGQLEWRRPNRVTLLSLLKHPIYAGFYRWGHRAVDSRKKKPGHRQSGRTYRAPKDCLVLLPKHCPAYISEEQFWANQERLSANRANATSLGAPRHGPSLLGGLLVCGRCGYRLMVNFNNAGYGLRYVCSHAQLLYGEPECQSLSGSSLDCFVREMVLSVLQPAALELHLAAVADVEQQRQRLHQQWQQQLERARYNAERAARQYAAVEPENRLVARELEHRWEEALREEQNLQQEYERFCATQPIRLSQREQEQIRALAQDIPELWDAQSTTAVDRQRLVRILIERIVVTVQGRSEQVELAIHWAGGFVSQHRVLRGVQRYEQLADYPRLLARIEQLRQQGKSLAEVASCLNAEGFHPPKRVERFTAGMVGGFLTRFCQKDSSRQADKARQELEKGEWLLGELARHLGMPQATLHRWRKAGWLRARKLPGGLWAIDAAGNEGRRLAQLRHHQSKHPNKPIPANLTTPGSPNEVT
jgi:DNA invertase Pin-like site-specific DNA recombinase